MGKIAIMITVQEEKANTKMEASKPNVSDLSVALAQIELMKLNILAKIARQTKTKDKDLDL